MRVAVVGAGIAGLTCARLLQDRGCDVVVMEKARGPSGRMSTRRMPEAALQFDHGAQYFTARSEAFREEVEGWVRAGRAARWTGEFARSDGDGVVPVVPGAPRFVGAPRMSALGRHLARGLRLECQKRVVEVESRGRKWWLRDGDGSASGPFDRVVVAVPAPQAVPLLQEVAPSFARAAARAEMVPCHAIMMAFSRRLELPFDGLECSDGPFSWIARDSSKPGRPEGETWVAHVRPEVAAAHLEEGPDARTSRWTRAFRAAFDVEEPLLHAGSHRWRYARAKVPGDAAPTFLHDDLGIGVCGDWLTGARVEAAWRSGRALAEAMSRPS